jgi:serine O-acetyltransferase
LNRLDQVDNVSLFEYIQSDIQRYGSFSSAITNQGFWVVFFYRFAHFFYKKKLGVFGFLIQGMLCFVFGCDISRKLIAGKGFSILHPDGIFVGPYVVLGKGITLNRGCFIGSMQNYFDNTVYPVLDDQVFVSTGAKLLGDILIGKESVVGPNAVVMKNIAANSTVLPPQCSVIAKYEVKKKSDPVLLDRI